jgi:hypothetical protein
MELKWSCQLDDGILLKSCYFETRSQVFVSKYFMTVAKNKIAKWKNYYLLSYQLYCFIINKT